MHRGAEEEEEEEGAQGPEAPDDVVPPGGVLRGEGRGRRGDLRRGTWLGRCGRGVVRAVTLWESQETTTRVRPGPQLVSGEPYNLNQSKFEPTVNHFNRPFVLLVCQ